MISPQGDWIAYALEFTLIVAWIALVLMGLEADKPLSGSLPGQLHRSAGHAGHTWDLGDRLGEVAAWLLFGAVCALLPLVLYWVLAMRFPLPRLPGVPI